MGAGASLESGGMLVYAESFLLTKPGEFWMVMLRLVAHENVKMMGS